METASRQAIDDLHQIVGFLRSPDDAGDLAPQPDLARLPALIDQMRDAGLQVELVVDGPARDRPAAMELSAYRIVQEALTNIIKHAGTTRAVVRVGHRDDGIDVEVLDSGRGDSSNGASGDGGKGLIGTRERVSLHGGRLEAGPRPGGGFRVCAALFESGA